MTSEIRPTGQCFDDAIEYITMRVVKDRAAAETLTLVHAIVTGDDGQPYAHAWVEEDGDCWDAGLIDGQRVWFAVERQEFYDARRVQQSTRYTVRELVRENARSRTYGPWRPEYRALCGGGGRIVGTIAATYQPRTK